MGVRVRSSGLEAKLENLAEKSSEGVREAMRSIVNKIGKRARMYAPVDQHNLENAICYPEIDKRAIANDGIKRRATFRVFVDEDMLALDPAKPSTAGKVVGDYAWVIHEGYNPETGQPFHWGEKTEAKSASLGVHCGEKYLSRAVDDYRDELKSRVAEIVKRGLRVGK